MVFLLLSPVFLTELCSFWYGLKDLFTLYKLGTKLSLTVKTDDVTKGTWIRTGGYGRFRGEWVKDIYVSPKTHHPRLNDFLSDLAHY